MRSLLLLVPVALLSVGCTNATTPLPGEAGAPTPCEQVIDGCRVPRLENLILHGDATDGVLTSIDGIDASDAIGSDAALAVSGDAFPEARSARTGEYIVGGTG